jgi:hypothetical protein
LLLSFILQASGSKGDTAKPSRPDSVQGRFSQYKACKLTVPVFELAKGCETVAVRTKSVVGSTDCTSEAMALMEKPMEEMMHGAFGDIADKSGLMAVIL